MMPNNKCRFGIDSSDEEDIIVNKATDSAKIDAFSAVNASSFSSSSSLVLAKSKLRTILQKFDEIDQVKNTQKKESTRLTVCMLNRTHFQFMWQLLHCTIIPALCRKRPIQPSQREGSDLQGETRKRISGGQVLTFSVLTQCNLL